MQTARLVELGSGYATARPLTWRRKGVRQYSKELSPA